jgi:hypothetical protein
MRPVTRYIAIIVTAAVVAAAGLLAFGCGGSGPKVDPAAVLSRSATAMKQIKGFHFIYEVHEPANTKPASGLNIVRITGDVNSAGNMQAVLDVTQGSVPLKLNFVQVGDTQYLQVGVWQKIPVESSPVGKLNLGAGTVEILQQVTGATAAGQQSKGGVQCYHITGSVAAAAVKAIATTVETTAPFPTDLWIGVKDDYIYEVDIHGPATAAEPQATWRSIILSKQNVSVDIKPPI